MSLKAKDLRIGIWINNPLQYIDFKITSTNYKTFTTL